jgi:hypothetical protein
LLAAALAPVWLMTMPPLVDCPNLLARMDTMPHGASFRAAAAVLSGAMGGAANLAMDLVVPPLARVTPLEAASEVFNRVTLESVSSGALRTHFRLSKRQG